VQNLEWRGKDAFNQAPLVEYLNPAGTSMGQVKTVDTLTFFKVYDAGHMVPMDQPENAL